MGDLEASAFSAASSRLHKYDSIASTTSSESDSTHNTTSMPATNGKADIKGDEVEPLQQDMSHQVLLGTVYNISSTVLVMIMGSCAKLAEEFGLPVMEVVLARSFALFIIPAATVLWQGQKLRGNRIWLLVVRGVCGTLGISMWYLALQLLPLTDVVVFGFLTPLFIALASPLVVKEYPSRMVFAMAPVCLIGVVLSVQPSWLFGNKQRLNTLGVIIAVSQAVLAGVTKLTIRELRTSESSAVIIFTAGLFAMVISGMACLLIPGQFVVPQNWQQSALLAATGIAAYLFQLTMTLGLRRIKAAPAAAVSYLTIVWGMAAGYVVFGEVPNWLSLLGALSICIGTLAVVISDSWPRQERSQHNGAPSRNIPLERKRSLMHSRPTAHVEKAILLSNRRSIDVPRKGIDNTAGRERLDSLSLEQ